MADQAAQALRQQGVGNVTVETRRHAEGDAAHGPYDAIVIEGRVPVVPEMLFDQLKEGGRLVAVVGNGESGPGDALSPQWQHRLLRGI